MQEKDEDKNAEKFIQVGRIRMRMGKGINAEKVAAAKNITFVNGMPVVHGGYAEGSIVDGKFIPSTDKSESHSTEPTDNSPITPKAIKLPPVGYTGTPPELPPLSPEEKAEAERYLERLEKRVKTAKKAETPPTEPVV